MQAQHMLGQRELQCVLVLEVLVERAHADAGALGDAIGGQRLVATTLQNLNCCLENRRNGCARTRLPWRSPLRINGLLSSRHQSAPPPESEYACIRLLVSIAATCVVLANGVTVLVIFDRAQFAVVRQLFRAFFFFERTTSSQRQRAYYRLVGTQTNGGCDVQAFRNRRDRSSGRALGSKYE